MKDMDPEVLVIAVSAIFATLAVWKFTMVFRSLLTDPVKQAKRYSMTARVVRRSDIIILLYAMLVFYEALMAIYQLPGRNLSKIAIDFVIQFLFAAAIIGMYFEDVAELNNNAGLGGADRKKHRHLWRVLNDRGLSLLEVVAAPFLVLAKYHVQGVIQFLKLPLTA
jgi:hypothetical protein